ncbi:MAG: metalloregulator ArsR/SmtB family transcription factor [Chloroflexi bacterium]|nr:metalloregulator ArsR/SmtB family transcription factor [Chloroflexota bacterium]
MSRETIFEIQAELCRAMGNPLRMEIMHLLRAGPMNVNDIASATHTHQATISRNLATLRNAGIVVAHREGSNTLCQVANPKIMSVCDMMREVLSEQIGEHSKLMDEANQ